MMGRKRMERARQRCPSRRHNVNGEACLSRTTTARY